MRMRDDRHCFGLRSFALPRADAAAAAWLVRQRRRGKKKAILLGSHNAVRCGAVGNDKSTDRQSVTLSLSLSLSVTLTHTLRHSGRQTVASACLQQMQMQVLQTGRRGGTASPAQASAVTKWRKTVQTGWLAGVNPTNRRVDSQSLSHSIALLSATAERAEQLVMSRSVDTVPYLPPIQACFCCRAL